MFWVKHPRKWALAQQKAGDKAPPGTMTFWRLCAEIYADLDGKLEESEQFPEDFDEC